MGLHSQNQVMFSKFCPFEKENKIQLRKLTWC